MGMAPILYLEIDIYQFLTIKKEKVMAKKKKIPYQVDAASGATGTAASAMQLSRAGVATGLEVLEKIRQMDERRSTPVVILTAKGQDADRQAAFSLGADDFLTKPFSPKKLLARIHEIIDGDCSSCLRHGACWRSRESLLASQHARPAKAVAIPGL